MQEEEKRFSLILPLILPLIIFVCVSAISLAILYIKCLPAPLLFDERYLITYLRPPAELSNCLKIPLTRYAGPEIGDTWGQLATFIAFFFAGLGSDSSLLFRLSGLLLHFLAGILVFLTSHALLKSLPSFSAIAGSYLLPFFMALFFSLYPLTVEPTFYLGGRAYQLGLIFLLLSLWLYMRARTHFSWSSLGFAGFAYVLALACDKTMWLASFSFVALFLTAHLLGESRKSEQRKNEPALDLAKTDEMEGAVERLLALEASESEKVKGEVEQESTISDTEKTSEEPTEQTSVKRDEARGTNELFDSLFPALPFIVIAAAACLATLPASPGEQLPKELVVNASDWLRIAKLLFMPINQSITEDYNKAYGYLLYLYIPPLLAVSFALFKSRPFRQHAAFLSIWLVLAVLPHMHQTIESASLTGARWLYHACVPVCGLLALLFFAPVFCVARKKYQALIASTISVVFSLLFLFFLRPLVNKQINSFREAATLTDKICNISRIVAEREAMEYVLVRNIPFKTSIIGTVSPFSIAMLDARTQLIRAPHMIGGRLKDAIKAKDPQSLVFHWENDFSQLLAVDLATADNSYGTSTLRFTDIEERLIPPLRYWNTASVNAENETFEILSNSTAGPVINISANHFAPTGPDFVYIDAKINTPPGDPQGDVRLTWLTTWGQELELRDRLAKTPAIANDGKYNRYFLPVRSSGWATNGVIQQLSFGFPASATISIKEIGAIDFPQRFARLDLEAAPLIKRKVLAESCFDFPTDPKLGLATLFGADASLNLSYKLDDIERADSGMLEISLSGKPFENPNGDSYSLNSSYRTIKLIKTTGKLELKQKDLRHNGIFYLRAFALDKNGNILGNSSDAIAVSANKDIEIPDKTETVR